MAGEDVLTIAFFLITFGAIATAWVTPGLVKRLWVSRQNGVLKRIRAEYVLGEQAIRNEDVETARRALDGILALERRWRRGDNRIVRALVGLISVVAAALAYLTVRALGFWGLEAGTGKSFADFGDAWMWLFLGVMGGLHGVAGIYELGSWRNRNEPEGLGARLRQMLEAGRGVAGVGATKVAAGSRKAARELFGLGVGFTRIELDRARRALARIHHPDRWSGASDRERNAHEAAMKRINSAYDLLAPDAK